MSLTRDQAWTHLCEWTETDSLRKHARAVEVVMRAAAHRYGEGAADEERFAIAGMLHDADYEKWPETHPDRIVSWLREQGEEEVELQAPLVKLVENDRSEVLEAPIGDHAEGNAGRDEQNSGRVGRAPLTADCVADVRSEIAALEGCDA